MPELPEVETVRRGLAELVVGHRLAGLEVREPKSFVAAGSTEPGRHLVGATITAARRRGKVLLLDLDTDHCLVIHLKMTGQLVHQSDGDHWGAGHPNDSLIGELPDRSTRIILDFDDGATLFFNDQRKFGWIQLLPAAEVGRIPLLAAMGPEPLEGDPWPEFLLRVRRHQATSIKAALLNQEVLAGVGNIYADEALWSARIHPATPVGRLRDDRLAELLDAARDVMERSLALGGSTARTYVDAQGRPGAYLSFAAVFRREGKPCLRCGETIVKTRVAGRGTHLCPSCQRLPRARRTAPASRSARCG